jgi:hypothetical protein
MVDLLIQIEKISAGGFVRMVLLIAFIIAGIYALTRVLGSFVGRFKKTSIKIGDSTIDLENEERTKAIEQIVEYPSNKNPPQITGPDSVKLTEEEEETLNKDGRLNLMDHSYFNRLRRVKNLGVHVKCDSLIKVKIIEEFLKLYSTVMYEDIGNWISEVIENNGKTLMRILEVKHEAIAEYQMKATTLVLNIRYKDKNLVLRGIPDLFLIKFENFYDPIRQTLLDQVSEIIIDIFHPTIESKIVGILDVLESIFRLNFVGVSATIQQLNGELDKYLEDELETLYKKSNV